MYQNYIGVFDSGIGGLTILDELKKIMPDEKFMYYNDSLNNPYGDKTNEEIWNIVVEIVDKLVNEGVKMIVIACNTASTVCVDRLRKIYKIPFIAAVPALKMAMDNPTNGKTIVMATCATLRGEKFLDIYRHYDKEKIILVSCSGLADLIEQKKDVDSKLKELLNPYLEENIHYIVLGCTHYLYIKKEILSLFPKVILLDGNKAIAHRAFIVNKSLSSKPTNI